MQPPRRPLLVGLIGLPGAGKSTLTRALVEQPGFHVHVLRVRNGIHHHHGQAQHSPDTWTGTSRPGPTANRTIGRLLDAAIHHRPIASSDRDITVIEGLPDGRPQTRLLRELSHRMNADVLLLELDLPSEAARKRNQVWRTCPSCEAIPGVSLHRCAPGAPVAETPDTDQSLYTGRCEICGGQLSSPAGPQERFLAERVRYQARRTRYQRRRNGILREAEEQHIPCVRIDASRTPEHTLHSTLAELTAYQSPAPISTTTPTRATSSPVTGALTSAYIGAAVSER